MSHLTTSELIQRLEDWRNADHEDAVTLPRSHVIMLLEATKAPTGFLDKLNEPQRDTLEKLRLTLFGSRHTDLRVRKDGQYQWFEVDWIRTALDMLCGPHPEIRRRVQEAIRINEQTMPAGASGPEFAQRQRSESTPREQ